MLHLKQVFSTAVVFAAACAAMASSRSVECKTQDSQFLITALFSSDEDAATATQSAQVWMNGFEKKATVAHHLFKWDERTLIVELVLPEDTTPDSDHRLSILTKWDQDLYPLSTIGTLVDYSVDYPNHQFIEKPSVEVTCTIQITR